MSDLARNSLLNICVSQIEVKETSVADLFLYGH